ncbi:MAG: hypothetical protein ACLQVY_12560 [Limisphaerales bacterium]
MVGNLRIVASSDLGPLGSHDGPAVVHNWVADSLFSQMLPWLALLGLLALKSNRQGSAWSIWLPLGAIVVLTHVPWPFLPSGADFFLDIVAALATGLAAVWLLSDSLRQRSRFLTFLCVFLVLAAFSALAFMAGQGWNLLNAQSVSVGFALALGVTVTAVVLVLAGLVCRGSHHPLWLYLLSYLLLAAVWLAMAAPFGLIAMTTSNGSNEWSNILMLVLIAATINYVVLLPFLILSSASPFFRERLKVLLHVKIEAPPLIVPQTPMPA